MLQTCSHSGEQRDLWSDIFSETEASRLKNDTTPCHRWVKADTDISCKLHITFVYICIVTLTIIAPPLLCLHLPEGAAITFFYKKSITTSFPFQEHVLHTNIILGFVSNDSVFTSFLLLKFPNNLSV